MCSCSLGPLWGKSSSKEDTAVAAAVIAGVLISALDHRSRHHQVGRLT